MTLFNRVRGAGCRAIVHRTPRPRGRPSRNIFSFIAAHAACFTMSFVRLLGMANFVPEQVDSKSEVVIDKDGDGFSITSVHLTVTAKIPGIDQVAFQSIAAGRLPCLQTDEG